MESKHTKGEWIVSNDNLEMVLNESGAYRPNSIMKYSTLKDELFANARLIANAGTTTNKCGLLPSELLERYNEAIESLKELMQVKEWKDEYGKDAQYLKAQPMAWSNAQSVLNKALKQPNIK